MPPTDFQGLRPIRRQGHTLVILDQCVLPHEERECSLTTLAQACAAIRDMQVRGAPLIGVTAAYGVALALQHDVPLADALSQLAATRPTAVNLHWALQRMKDALLPLDLPLQKAAAWRLADELCDEDIACNRAIGEHGLGVLRALPGAGERTLNIMTHCNAGALATAGNGTALAPIYLAHAAGLALHVWVSETRPRNQGLLTAWELNRAGVPHTLIADNAAGQLMREGRVDAVIVGADRIAANGDVANKVGTYLKALAAQDCGVPFYVAAPRSTFDAACACGTDIPIECRAGSELGAAAQVPTHNPAFDITPARLVCGIICETGVVAMQSSGG